MATKWQSVQNDPQLQRYVIPNVRSTDKELGVGSYGSVEELEINSLICAGKRIHESLIKAGNAGVQNIVRKYVKECQLMSEMRHPHIVQFMGVCFLPSSSLPVLVMEKLLMSLDDLLENTPDIPLALKRSMLADVSKGLVFLHSCSSPIIHRDLSAKNVLLNSAMTAKISDLGNSRIVDLQPGQLMKTLSRIPGTVVYMPPEALYSLPGYEAEKSQYGTKIDIFSFGHLSLFTMTQVFPQDLLPPTYPDPNSHGRLVAVTEVERRGKYIDQLHHQLGERHPMVQLIKQCLNNDPQCRPSSQDVLQRLEGMRSLIQDPYLDLTKVEMMKLLEQKDREIQSHLQQGQGSQAMEALILQYQQVQLEKSGSERALQEELEVRRNELSRLQGDLRALQSDISTKDGLLQEKDGQLQEKDSQLQEKNTSISALQSDISAKDGLIQEKDGQLQEKNTSISVLQSDISSKDMLLSSVRAEVDAREETLQSQPQTHQVEPILQRRASLQWKKCSDLPVGMGHAQAAVLKNKVYLGGGYAKDNASEATLCVYTPTDDMWATLPSPARQSALTVYHSQLVLVGGMIASTGKTTNQLWVLQEDEQTWRQPLTAMPTARHGASAISYHNHLTVIGGTDSKLRLMNVVEVYDGRQWMETDPLPIHRSYMKTTIHNGICYLMGGINPHQSVFYASIFSLIAKATQHSFTSPGQKSVWETLPDVPYELSSTTILGTALVTVGGKDSGMTPTSSFYMYSPSTNSWLHVGNMPVAVSATCTITLPNGKMMVIGGKIKGTLWSRTVYMASL